MTARLLLLAALCLPACTAAEGQAIKAPLLSLGEAACDALLPLALPAFGALDVLVCKGAEKLIEGVLAGETPVPPPAATLSGAGGVAPREPLPWRPLVVGGKPVSWVRAEAAVVGRAQARIDAAAVKAMPFPPGGTR